MRRMNDPITLNRRKTAALTKTTLAPAGVEYKKETVIPIKKHATEIIPEEIITRLKLLKIRIDVKAGKIIKLEINIVPIILILFIAVGFIPKLNEPFIYFQFW